MNHTPNPNDAAPRKSGGGSASPDASAVEQARIDFLVRRDGVDAAVEWVRRTMPIYRQAVLNKRHFASTPDYRPRFIVSYCTFKAWLARIANSSSDKKPSTTVRPL
jgi:hypothetical protein